MSEFDHPASLKRWYWAVRLLALGILRVCGGLRSSGEYRVPREGGLLILANHLAYLDPIPIQVTSPRLIHFMGKADLFKMGWLGAFMRWFRAFAVNPQSPDTKALRLAIQLLKEGRAVCMFPEGGTNQTGRLAPLFAGAALIARRSGAQVICCGLQNCEHMMPGDSRYPLPCGKPVIVAWGEPKRFEPHAADEEILGWARGQLIALKDEEKPS